jgi:hypothetical protein
MPPTTAVKKTPEQINRSARQVATKAINDAAELSADGTKNRSTRSRTAYKKKAEALDRVARILSGKE